MTNRTPWDGRRRAVGRTPDPADPADEQPRQHRTPPGWLVAVLILAIITAVVLVVGYVGRHASDPPAPIIVPPTSATPSPPGPNPSPGRPDAETVDRDGYSAGWAFVANMLAGTGLTDDDARKQCELYVDGTGSQIVTNRDDFLKGCVDALDLTTVTHATPTDTPTTTIPAPTP